MSESLHLQRDGAPWVAETEATHSQQSGPGTMAYSEFSAESSDFEYEALEPLPDAPAPVELRRQKMSAVAITLVVHAALVVLLALLVVIVPEPPVSELTGYMMPSAQEQSPVQKVVPTMSTPPSPVSSATQLLTAVGVSSVTLPEFEIKADSPDMNIVTTDLGAGFSSAFAPKGSSQVNFFGIQSAGKRIMFLIDAHKTMLTDSRGGYPAYEIVKSEIAGMIGKMGLDSSFNVALFDGNAIAPYSEKMMPATSANKAKIAEWLEPVNKVYEKLGVASTGYPRSKLRQSFDPIPSGSMTGYLLALQFAMESDSDTIFIINSQSHGIGVPRSAESQKGVDAKLAQARAAYTDKDAQAWSAARKAAVAHANSWLAKENDRRRKSGIAEKVVTSIDQVIAESGFKYPAGIRRPPSAGLPNATHEQREQLLDNANRLLYLDQGKPKPQINFVVFIGKDQDKDSVKDFDHYQRITKKFRKGKSIILQGLAAIKNVSGR